MTGVGERQALAGVSGERIHVIASPGSTWRGKKQSQGRYREGAFSGRLGGCHPGHSTGPSSRAAGQVMMQRRDSCCLRHNLGMPSFLRYSAVSPGRETGRRGEAASLFGVRSGGQMGHRSSQLAAWVFCVRAH